MFRDDSILSEGWYKSIRRLVGISRYDPIYTTKAVKHPDITSWFWGTFTGQMSGGGLECEY